MPVTLRQTYFCRGIRISRLEDVGALYGKKEVGVGKAYFLETVPPNTIHHFFPHPNITTPTPFHHPLTLIKYEYREPINLINVLCARSCIYMPQTERRLQSVLKSYGLGKRPEGEEA